MIIYIHGFASSGNAAKAKLTKEFFHPIKVMAPTLPVEPKSAFSRLKDIIREANTRSYIIGSSLGGFYAMLLSAKYGYKSVLINPAVSAHISLESYIGTHTNFDTGEKFEWTKEYVCQLKRINDELSGFIKQKNLFLLLSKDDELIDHTLTKKAFPDSKIIKEYNNSGHQFSRYVEALPEIQKFFYGK